MLLEFTWKEKGVVRKLSLNPKHIAGLKEYDYRGNPCTSVLITGVDSQITIPLPYEDVSRAVQKWAHEQQIQETL